MTYKKLFLFSLLSLVSGIASAQTIISSQLQFNPLGITGDCSLNYSTITCTKTGGVAFAPSATVNALNASNISSGTLPAARLPALTGDVTSTVNTVTTVVGKVNGVTFPSSPSTHQVPVVTAANTVTYKTISDCTTGLLQYTQSTDLFSCGTSATSLTLTTPTLTTPTFTAYRETVQAVTAAATTNIDLSLGNIVALSQSTAITSLTFSNCPSSGPAYSLTIERTKDNSATARLITWPASVKWPAATAPILTSTANAVDIITMYTRDACSTFRATSTLDSR
jgi:hypothetical protein